MRVVVVGGGIAGLSAAFHLQEEARAAGRSLECILVERDTRTGGKIATGYQDGFVAEGGPDCFMSQKPWALDLCRRLGLGDQLIGTNESARKVHILWNGRMHPLPDGVFLIIPTRFMPFALSSLISPLGKLRMGMDLLIPARRDDADESVADFVRRRLGSEALDKIAEPLMGGVHVSNPENQSLLATFPRFRDTERKYGSLVKGMVAARRRQPSNGKALPMFMTLKGGLQVLTSALTARLDGVRVITGLGVARMGRGDDRAYRLALDDGSQIDADHVVLAVPAYEAAKLVSGLDGELASRLGEIRFVSTATVSLGYRREDLSHQLNGFGFLIPSKEGRQITGCTWSSTKFDNRAPDGHALVRCFLGGAIDEAPALLPEDEMVRLAREELRDLMGIDAEPVLVQVYRWRDGHPQYEVGHLDRIAEIERLTSAHPGLHLIGSSYRGVGIPDCIKSGALAAGAVLEASFPR